jgi:hypothetical protein
MRSMEKRRLVTNDRKSMLLIFTEPEAQDFWLRPGESLELSAEVDSPSDDFEFQEVENGYQVYPSDGMGYISAWIGGRELAVGHQRPNGR